jgi:hypothetical protein
VRLFYAETLFQGLPPDRWRAARRPQILAGMGHLDRIEVFDGSMLPRTSAQPGFATPRPLSSVALFVRRWRSWRNVRAAQLAVFLTEDLIDRRRADIESLGDIRPPHATRLQFPHREAFFKAALPCSAPIERMNPASRLKRSYGGNLPQSCFQNIRAMTCAIVRGCMSMVPIRPTALSGS